MTYPPQQPGPGGWDQHSDQGTAGTPQQQPAWYGNQHTGWGQQHPFGQPEAGQAQPGQFQPGQSPFPPQPAQPPPGAPRFPPPPDWGSGEFGQNSWVQEPDGFAAVAPPQKKSPMPWLLGVLGVLVVAGAGVGASLFSGGPGEAKPVAQEVVDKVNSHEFDALGPHLCQRNRAELEAQLDLLEPGEFQVHLRQVSERGEKASAQLTGSYVMSGSSQKIDQTMGLVVEDGAWKVCDLDQ